MRETSEALDDVPVLVRELQIAACEMSEPIRCLIPELAEQAHGRVLIDQRFRVLEGQVEKTALIEAELRVQSPFDPVSGRVQGRALRRR